MHVLKKYTSGVLLLGLFNTETQHACFPVPMELYQLCQTREALWHSWGNVLTPASRAGSRTALKGFEHGLHIEIPIWQSLIPDLKPASIPIHTLCVRYMDKHPVLTSSIYIQICIFVVVVQPEFSLCRYVSEPGQSMMMFLSHFTTQLISPSNLTGLLHVFQRMFQIFQSSERFYCLLNITVGLKLLYYKPK